MAPPLNCNCNNNSIVAILCNQRVTGSFCDTILKVNDKVFFAHSCILAAASSFFQRFFIDSFPRRFSQASPQVVEIQTLHDKSCEMYEKAVLITLDYMYTGKVNCNDKFFDELFEIARMLELDELIQICSKLSNGNLSNKRTSHANILSKKKNKSFLKQNKAERLVSVATQVSCDVDEDFVKNSEDITSVVKFNDVSKLSALDGNYAFTVNSTSSNDSKYSPINMNFEAYNNDSNESLNPHSADQQLPLNKLVSNNSKYCDNLFQSESDILQQPTSKISVPDFHNESSNTNNHPLHLYVDDSLNSTEPIEMRISHNKDEKSLIGASKNSRYIKKASSNNNSASQPTVDKYQCDSCCYSTNSVRMMSRHCKLHKIEQKVCFYCDSQFSSEDALTDHMVSHKGSEPFVCLHCNACFKSRTYLDIHMAKHSCERPFICHVCSMAFKWKHALKNHLIVHNNHKEYLCDNCGYTTAHRSQLKAHCLLHTGDTYKCNYPGCMFQSTKKQNMKYHQLTHTHEKVHQCDICGQSFSLLKNLRRHSLLHNSIRQHRCDQCTFSTTRFDKLREHQFHHHAVGTQPEKRKQFSSVHVSKSMQIVKAQKRGKASDTAHGVEIANNNNMIEKNDISKTKEHAFTKNDCLEYDEQDKNDEGEQAVYSLTTNCFPSLQILPLAQTLLISQDLASDFLLSHSLHMPFQSSNLDDITVLDPSKTGLPEVDPPGDFMSNYGIFQAELNLGCSMELMGSNNMDD